MGPRAPTDAASRESGVPRVTMQIRLLGTGASEGCPGLFCACPTCRRIRAAGGRNLRSRSCALIDGVIKIDLPPDTLHHVLTQNLDLSVVRHLLFTHGHDDHFAVAELQYLSWMFIPYPVKPPLHVVAPPDIISRIRSELDMAILPLDLQVLELWTPLTIERWTVTAIHAQHAPGLQCYNYIVEDGAHAALYATDTGWWAEPTWEFLAGRRLDAAIVECTKGLDEGGYKAHLSVPEVIRLRERLIADGALADDAPVVTTHHSHLAGLLHEELEEHLTPHGIQVGYDGMVLDV